MTEETHAAHHAPQSFISKYIFSRDHKVIGVQYLLTSAFAALASGALAMIMRIHLAWPQETWPLLEKIFPQGFSKGVLNPDFYLSIITMHGTLMVFFFISYALIGAFGNFLIPLQIGARDMAYPLLNMLSYWFALAALLVMLASFFVPGGGAASGWTAYPPLSAVKEAVSGSAMGQTFWILGMALFIVSFTMGGLNYFVTIINLRAPGLTWSRLPMSIWSFFVATCIGLVAFPPLTAAAVMLLFDRHAGTSFFLPEGLFFGSKLLPNSGGIPLLWQHLFWFLGHPEVYVLILPAMGVVSEIVACNTRKPLWGYKSLVYSVLAVGFISFIVWAHHMYLTGMGTKISTFFQTTTMIISIPSVIILTCLFMSLWGGSIRFNTPMLFALAFLPMFGIGGLTGLPLGFNFSDLHLHDSYYVIAHFHYVVAPGTIFALFAGIYFWYPKMTGRYMSETLGKIHFWGSLIGMNLVFTPMFFQGLYGMSRRMSDGGATYALSNTANEGVVTALTGTVMKLNVFVTHAAFLLLLAQIPFIINVFTSMFNGKKVESDNPWEATTLDWQTPTPPPHGNFTKEIVVHRGPYEYSVPGHPTDFTPQNAPDPKPAK